ncbi:MAG: FKBP-type peptidyl-prolyl cis-trans isomerase [Bacteroides sp.]|nr:FKBP-type peptidyl-prolyl cis-trans isomerase [Bacteroides sp.]
MKKVSFLMVAAVAIGLASCTAQPKANLKSDVDTLSYAIGMERTDGLMGYLVNQVRMDTTHMSDFMKGFSEGSNKVSAKDIAYITGLQIGQMVGKHWVEGLNREIFGDDSTKTISKENMLAGFYAGVNGKDTTIMTMQKARMYSQEGMQRIKDASLSEQFKDNKEEGEKFLDENKGKDGVVTTESGLQYKIITQGKGEIPTENDRVKVNYKGTLIDGTEFDSSYKRNEPATFRANQVIKGWTEALTMMPVGSKWELYIPQDLAYGSRNQGQIKPFSTLVFEVELVGIEK